MSFLVHPQGKVTPYELYVFFKEIHIMWVTVLGEYPDLAIYDVVDELLDMIRPKDPPNITQVSDVVGRGRGSEEAGLR